MKRLIIHGDPGIRKGAIIEVDGEEYSVFGINRNGEWHGPDRVQLWCTIGDETERDDYELRAYTPHFLDVLRAQAEEITVVKPKADPATS